ncbi:hypothetical protein [Persephonella sp.]
MKYIFAVLWSFVLFASAFPQVAKEKLIEMKIIEKLVRDITGRSSAEVYIAGKDRELFEALKKSKIIKITDRPKKAEFIIILTGNTDKQYSRPSFALGYLAFKNCRWCIGGLYWRKGRPQLILVKEKLEKFGIKLPEEYRFYIIREKELTR